MCYFQVQKLSETIGEKEKESCRADYHTEHRNGTLISKHTSPPTCKLELGDGEYIGPSLLSNHHYSIKKQLHS